MANNECFNISFLVEGEIERDFLLFLKAQIYKLKTVRVCKKHSSIIGGTISVNDINNNNKGCCKKIYIFDKDEIDEKTFLTIKSKILKFNLHEVTSNPCLEIVILCLFQDISSIKTKQEVYNELKKEANKIGLKFEKNSKRKDLEKIYKWFERKVKLDPPFIMMWENRLEKLKAKQISNFIDIIKLMKEHNNGN